MNSAFTRDEDGQYFARVPVCVRFPGYSEGRLRAAPAVFGVAVVATAADDPVWSLEAPAMGRYRLLWPVAADPRLEPSNSGDKRVGNVTTVEAADARTRELMNRNRLTDTAQRHGWTLERDKWRLLNDPAGRPLELRKDLHEEVYTIRFEGVEIP